MNRKLSYSFIVSAIFLLFITPIIFGKMAIDAGFLLMSFIIILITVIYYSYGISNIGNNHFLKTIFIYSLIIRILSVFIYLSIFNYVTGTPFEVTFADSRWYDEQARILSSQYRNGDFNIFWLFARYVPDLTGYSIFLSFIYFLSNDSIIIARLIQAFISSYTVIIAYKIGVVIWDEWHARHIALLFSGFPPFIIYSTLHLREFLMVFLFLCVVLYFIRIIVRNKKYDIIILSLLLILFLFIRTAFVVVLIASFAVYFFLFDKRYLKKIHYFLVVGAIFLVIISLSGILDSAYYKILGYIGLESGQRLGGYSQDLVVSRGMSLAQYIGGPLFIIPSFVFPMPSILKLMIENFGQSMHWYFTGGIIIWVYFSLAFFRGMYLSLVKKNKLSIFLIIIIVIMSIALLESFYFTSIRFNQVKMALLLMFVPMGLKYYSKKVNNYIIFLIFMNIIILVYNYLRIFGRG